MSPEEKDKLEFQARISRESKMPRPSKKIKIHLPEKTQHQKNQEHFDHLENL